MNKTIAFIGCGHLATAAIDGLLSAGFDANNIIATRRDQEKVQKLAQKFSIKTTTNNIEAILAADIVAICVKPGQIQELADEISETVTKHKPLLFSVAAGTPLRRLESCFGKIAIARVIPNTPIEIRQGISCMIANEFVSDEQKQFLDDIFKQLGLTHWFDDEKQLEHTATLTGAGPAFIYTQMQTLKTMAEDFGLNEETLTQLICQLTIGSASLAQKSGKPFQQLINEVAVPNGTTERAMKVFQNSELQTIFNKAIGASIARVDELAKN